MNTVKNITVISKQIFDDLRKTIHFYSSGQNEIITFSVHKESTTPCVHHSGELHQNG